MKGTALKKVVAALLLALLLTLSCRRTAQTPSAPEVTDDSTAAPAATAEAPAAYAFPFTAKTLEGETMTEAVLGQYDLTMVNVWASWCGPCRSELGELAELYGKLPENVGFLSVTVDEAGDLDDAKALLEENGCSFPSLDGQGSEGLMNGFLRRITAIPTTLFLDRSGNQVGQWIVGVPQGGGSVADAYMSEIQARLDLLNGK